MGAVILLAAAEDLFRGGLNYVLACMMNKLDFWFISLPAWRFDLSEGGFLI
jgi:hypothetical protein